jgi:ABC-type lipoprotein export system ATPase subunit
MFKIFSHDVSLPSNGAAAKNGGALIDLRQVEKAYQTPAGDFYALKGIDLQVQQGEFVGVVGKSGAGKSTLINMVTGIDRPTSGQVRVGHHEVQTMNEDQVATWRGQSVGVIFQFFQLLPMLTCAQNVMLPMDFANVYHSPKERRERALYLLEQVEIAEHADKLPSAVSGGQRQRVAIARALANDPMFLAADEPTGNLDSKTANAVFRVFEKLVDEGKTILMVTHDRELASRVSRTVHLADGEIVDEAHRTRVGWENEYV